MYEIVNKVILITGAAKGIGAEIVKIFLVEGAKQVTILDVDDESGHRLEEQLNREYGEDKIKFIKCDITKEDQLFGAFNVILEVHGHIDLVVNNAGLADESSMELIRKEIEIALVQSTLKALEMMRLDNGGKGGTIINVSSLGSLCQVSPALFVYLGTKSAVMQFSNCIGRHEYYSITGVRVLTVCFGNTSTDILLRSFDEWINKQMQEIKQLYPMQEKDSAALGLLEVFTHGESGSTWLVANNKPALDVTENVKNAYKIMSEPLINSS